MLVGRLAPFKLSCLPIYGNKLCNQCVYHRQSIDKKGICWGVSQLHNYILNIKMACVEGLGAVQESLLQEITCNICLKLMEDPRTLSCTHVYCYECLKRLVQRSQATLGCLQCPECRKTVLMPSNDTLDLPKDFRTVRLKEVYEKMLQISHPRGSPTTSTLKKSAEVSMLKCQLHGSPIEMYCISCRDILCKECVQIHESHKYDYLIEKNVTLRSINLNEQPVAHKSRLDDYSTPLLNTQAMKECDNQTRKAQLMAIEGHHSCTTIRNNDVVRDIEQHENQHKELNTIVLEVNKYSSKVATAITEVVQIKSEVDSQARTRLSQIDAAFEGMISLVQGKWQHLRSEVADEQREKNDALSQQKDQLTQLFREIENLSTACSSRALQDNESIQQRLENLQQTMKTISLKPAVTADVAISLTKGDLVKTCCNRCELRYRIPDVNRCKLSGNLLRAPETDKELLVNLDVRDSKGNVCPGFHKIEAELVCVMNNSKMTGTLTSNHKGMYSISFILSGRGRHMLNITLENVLLPECPIALFIMKRPETLQAPIYKLVNQNGPTGLCFYGNQLVASEQSSFTVSVYNENGSRARTIETGGEVAIDRESQCYYIANAITYQLHKFDANGVCMEQVGTQGSGPGQLLNPSGMEYYNGELYVVDTDNHRIQVFDKDLKLLRHFGREGVSNGCFKSPTDVAVDDGKLYITDTLNNRIQVMDHKGKFIRNIKKIDKQRQYPHMPQKIKIFKGYIYTTEYYMNSVCVFTLAGNFVTTFGQGHITHPEGITFNKDGYVYITSNKETIVVF